jgi:cell division protease FtsH
MEPSKISDKMQSAVDDEIKKFINQAFEEAKKVLNKNKKKLEELAKKLVDKESLDQEEFEELMK